MSVTTVYHGVTRAMTAVVNKLTATQWS